MSNHAHVLGYAAALVALGVGCSAPPQGAASPPPTAAGSAALPSSGTTAAPAASGGPAAPAEAAPAASASAAPAGPDRDLNDIVKTVSANRGLFRACYDKALKAHPGIEGKFVLKFAIKPDGTVKSVDVDLSKSQIRTEDMINCALQAGRGLKFAESATGMQSAASYPFDFHPKAAKP
jgi:hypothetical protein